MHACGRVISQKIKTHSGKKCLRWNIIFTVRSTFDQVSLRVVNVLSQSWGYWVMLFEKISLWPAWSPWGGMTFSLATFGSFGLTSASFGRKLRRFLFAIPISIHEFVWSLWTSIYQYGVFGRKATLDHLGSLRPPGKLRPLWQLLSIMNWSFDDSLPYDISN